MKIHRERIEVESKSQADFIDMTDRIQEAIERSGVREGMALVYAPHTTMGIAVNHNEPMLIQDFTRVLFKFAPVDEQYSHDLFELRRANKTDGRSNGHSHCKSLVIGVSETIPVEKGRLIVTEKQSVFAVELDGPRKRDVVIQIMGI